MTNYTNITIDLDEAGNWFAHTPDQNGPIAHILKTVRFPVRTPIYEVSIAKYGTGTHYITGDVVENQLQGFDALDTVKTLAEAKRLVLSYFEETL